jgi:hypothetical protein
LPPTLKWIFLHYKNIKDLNSKFKKGKIMNSTCATFDTTLMCQDLNNHNKVEFTPKVSRDIFIGFVLGGQGGAKTTQQPPKHANAIRDECGEWMGNYVFITCEHELKFVKDECSEWI